MFEDLRISVGEIQIVFVGPRLKGWCRNTTVEFACLVMVLFRVAWFLSREKDRFAPCTKLVLRDQTTQI